MNAHTSATRARYWTVTIPVPKGQGDWGSDYLTVANRVSVSAAIEAARQLPNALIFADHGAIGHLTFEKRTLEDGSVVWYEHARDVVKAINAREL